MEGPTLRLEHSGDVLVVARLNSWQDSSDVAAALGELTRRYTDATGLRYRMSWTEHAPNLLVAVLRDDSLPSTPTSTIVWGQPIGASGSAREDELETAFRDGDPRELLGTWCAVVPSGDELCLFNGTDVVHTWAHATGRWGQAWATQGAAAAAVVGLPLELEPAAVVEFVHLEYVLNDRSLLRGVRNVPEASVITVRADSASESSYWSRASRFAQQPRADASLLRSALTADVVRTSAAVRTRLMLTCGRDSSLIASCLHDAGLQLPTATLGGTEDPDVVGAAAIAAAWSVPHTRLLPSQQPGFSYQRAVRRSIWTEGAQTARITAGSLLPGGGLAGTWNMLSGSGGEAARAFYWRDADPMRTPPIEELVDRMIGPAAPSVPESARKLMHDSTYEALALQPAGEAGGWASLDQLYVLGRMRSWLRHALPKPDQGVVHAGFLSPQTLQAMAALPIEQRVDGQAFRAALALGRPDFYAIATAAVTPRRSVLRRLRRSRPAPAPVADPLPDLLQHLRAGGVVHELLGPAWVAELATSMSSPSARRQAWNALAVQALEDAISGGS